MSELGWTEARVDLLKQSIESKMSSREAAAALNVSRNTVIGKAFRLGLKFLSEVHAPRGTRTPRPKRSSNRSNFFHPPRPERAPLPPVAPEPNSRSLSLIELERNDCRFPTTADTPFLFCGHPKSPDHPSYCAHHARRSIEPSRPRPLNWIAERARHW